MDSQEICFGILLLAIPIAYAIGNYYGEKKIKGEIVSPQVVEMLARERYQLMLVVEALEAFFHSISLEKLDYDENHNLVIPTSYAFKINKAFFDSDGGVNYLEVRLDHVLTYMMEFRKVSNLNSLSANTFYIATIKMRQRFENRNKLENY